MTADRQTYKQNHILYLVHGHLTFSLSLPFDFKPPHMSLHHLAPGDSRQTDLQTNSYFIFSTWSLNI